MQKDSAIPCGNVIGKRKKIYMLLYFEFEDQRRRAEVTWPGRDENIMVHILEQDLAAEFPTDLYYTFDDNNRITFTIEDIADKRFIELQTVIKRRLDEVNK